MAAICALEQEAAALAPYASAVATGTGRLAAVAAALLLVAVAAVYLGFAFADGSPMRIATELVGLVVFAGAALIGLDQAIWIIPTALALHVGWDWMHHARALGGAPSWFPTACALFDLPVAASIAWRLCF